MSDISVNADVIAGLREVADLLEAHPELPVVYWASVRIGGYLNSLTREDMERVAAVIPEPTERLNTLNDVEISGHFSGNVELSAAAKVEALGGRRTVFEYTPILHAGAVA
jgi:hypothetical protein